MADTITLTPTLTLVVAGQHQSHETIEDIWSAIAQHVRATRAPSVVPVLDGAQRVRSWRVALDGTRSKIENADTAMDAFAIQLSPWEMTVPTNQGAVTREVSTLEVARAQAQEAATAGDTEIILQIAGTDADTAETITPEPPEAEDSATEPSEAADDADEDDLLAGLADEDSENGPTPQQRRTRRRVLIGGGALSLVLVASLGLAGWSVVASPDPAPQPTQTASPSDTSTAAVQNSDAVAPEGFSGTPQWSVVGATDQSSSLSWAGKHVGAVSGTGLNIVDAKTGQLQKTITLPHAPEQGPIPLADPDTEGGLLMATENSVMTWSPVRGFKSTNISTKDRLIMRGPVAFTVPQTDDVRPKTVKLVTTNGLVTYKTPGSSASPIVPIREGGFLWASGSNGGSLVTAGKDGRVRHSTRLIGPNKNMTISRWIGATEKHAAVIWTSKNSTSGSTENVLVVHDAKTGKVVNTQPLGMAGTTSNLRVVPSLDRNIWLAGNTPVNLETGKIESKLSALSESDAQVRAVPGGWVGTNNEGRSVFLPLDGKPTSSPVEKETLLGAPEPGELIVDHRGTIAAFTSTPTNQGDQK